MKKKILNFVWLMLLLILDIVFLFGVSNIKVSNTSDILGPKIVPMMIGSLVGIILFVIIIMGIRKNKEKADNIREENNKRVIYAIVLMLFYVSIFEIVGFIFSSLFFVIMMALLLTNDKKKLRNIAIVSVLFSLIIFCIFKYFLQMNLPMGGIV